MSKSSKSVNLEDYYDHQARQNESSEAWKEETYTRNFNDLPRGILPQRYNAATNNNFRDFSKLPPPLEPRERLLPCIDPVSADLNVIPHWYSPLMISPRKESYTDKITTTSSYIMPSSLASVSHHQESNNTIPPPTAFRDEVCRFKNLYHQCTHYDNKWQGQRSDDGGSGSSTSCDIIEIKRPGSVRLRRDESEYGLAYQYQPSLQCSNQLTENDWQRQTGSNEQSNLRSGLFNLPEVYCPPPLAPVYQKAAPDFNSTPQSQIQGLMPSFFTKTTVSNPLSNRSYELKILKSPRHAYSEPILKPDFERSSFSQQHRPETGRFSVSVKNATSNKERFLDLDSKGDENYRRSMQELQTENNNDYVPETRSSFRITHDGSGDKTETQVVSKQVKLSTHNCLSPRARLSPLKPSVITPAVTESLLLESLSNLKSTHWEDNYEAFSQIYNLTELHPGRVKNILPKIIWHSLPHLSSPRTKLARMACICFKRLYQTQKRSMETEGERVFYRLLDLCGGLANNFIQQESREALVAAVEHMDPLKSLSFLELHGAKHKNPHVREFSAYLLSTIMDELPQTKLMNKEFSPRIIPMIVSFLREGLLQTRLHAKLALDKIYDHPCFESKLKRYVSPENVRHITDTLREFRERRSGHV